MNNLKAAMTRATDTLVVFQKKAHETRDLIAFFQEGVMCSSMKAMDLTDKEKQELSYKQACWLYSQGQFEMALGIIKSLNVSKDDFLREVNPAPANGGATSSVSGRAPNNAPDNPSQNVSRNVPKPLNKLLNQYVEEFYKKYSETNLKKLLVHERAAHMLFHHKMANGQCLFLNLLFTDRLLGPNVFLADRFLDSLRSILQDKTKEAQALVAALSSISDHDYFLRLVLTSIGNKRIDSQTLSFERIQEMGLGCLFVGRGTAEQKSIVEYLVRRGYFLTEQDLTHQYRHEEGTQAHSLLYLLASYAQAWTSFFSRNADQLTILKNAMSCQAKKDNTYNIKTVLSLVQTTDGQKWFFDNINLMASYVNEDVLSALLCSPGGGQIPAHWNKLKMLLSIERLFAPLTDDGADKGKTPFYLFCSNPEGLELLTRYWDDFKKHFQAKELFTEETESTSGKKESCYSLLNATKEGKDLLLRISLEFPNAGFSITSSPLGLFATRRDKEAAPVEKQIMALN